jgi:hypothetical protein
VLLLEQVLVLEQVLEQVLLPVLEQVLLLVFLSLRVFVVGQLLMTMGCCPHLYP